MRILTGLFLLLALVVMATPSQAGAQVYVCKGCDNIGSNQICTTVTPFGRRDWCIMFEAEGSWWCNHSTDFCIELVYDELAVDLSVTAAGTLTGTVGLERMVGDVVRLCNGAVVTSYDESPLPKEISFTIR